ncbi:hypothetical protein D3C85_1194650 [compost metagenome]
MRTDARITADAAAHLFYVDIEWRAESRHFIDERNLGRQKRIGRVLAELCRTYADAQQAFMVAQKWRIQATQNLASHRVVTADDDPIRTHEVIDRRSFLEKLRVTRHRDPEWLATLVQTGIDQLCNLLASTHRHRGFIHHDAGVVEALGQ